MKKIAIFSVNAQYKVGGAETCINQMYEALCDNYEVVIISGDRRAYNKYCKFNYPNIQIVSLLDIKFFNYFNNFINYFIIFKFFTKNEYDLVIANCSTGIAAVNATCNKNRKSFYYVHEEFSLNIRPEYIPATGLIKKTLRQIRKLIDYPFFVFHCIKNSHALQNSDATIANSKYIADRIEEQELIKPRIIYPFTSSIGKPILEPHASDSYITMIGSGEVKGISTFLKIARLMPNEKFRVIGRGYEEHMIDNVLFHPFFEDVENLYSTSKLILAPSIWREAFGKVSVEASSYGIPVIVSNRGGLPETVCDDALIVKDYKNPHAWLAVIYLVLKERDRWSKRCREHSHLFDEKYDIKKLLSLIQDLEI
ncbi:glycosyltransferase family 4 protein [Vibrio atypicus]|uniref:glycosyltransferase family 4 protein n=1 Tax=Vibrio atypicus TaxID=558271 RepID=UPI001356A216|nr:glycosyltransferase family 4 protein [Vibrio atypicus]